MFALRDGALAHSSAKGSSLTSMAAGDPGECHSPARKIHTPWRESQLGRPSDLMTNSTVRVLSTVKVLI